jgi:hypothetical protein
MRQVTIARTFTVAAGATRAEVYLWALNQCPPEFANGNVLFFSAEPNVLPAEAGEVAEIASFRPVPRPGDCRCIWQGSVQVETCRACREVGR